MSVFPCCDADPTPDHYHALCRREFTDGYGIRHVCGCLQHLSDDEKAAS